MNLNDLRELDLQYIGDWPLAARFAVVGIIGVLVPALGSLFVITPLLMELNDAQREEANLKRRIAAIQRSLTDPDAFERYLRETEARFDTLLRQLPDEAEVETLVEDLSQTGVAHDLAFHSFAPGPTVTEAFYAERSIELEMKGAYHQLRRFINAVASLPRMVTLHDIGLTPNETGAAVTMKATAKIYWYPETASERKREEEGVP